ncbi:hypothetical protein [Vibrio parahaemolyticus]
MKPEEIYLLFCLIKSIGIGSKFSKKSIDISKEFGVSLNVVTSLLATLKRTQSIVVEEQYSLKGRGQYSYTLTEKMLLNHDEFGVLGKIAQTENPTISRLLKNELSGLVESEKPLENEVKGIRQRSPFRASNRLFLVLLLLHSNELGVVEEISSTYLCKLMGGISADRFKSQLNTLKQFGLVQRYIAGITGKELFGRTKGSYYLDIAHPFLKDGFVNTSSLLLDFNYSLYSCNESTEVKCLFDAYRHTWNTKEQKTDFILFKDYGWSPIMVGLVNSIPVQLVIHFFRNKALHDQIHQWVYQVAAELMVHPFTAIEDIQLNQCSDKLVALLSMPKFLPATKKQSLFKDVSIVKKNKLRFHKGYLLSDALEFDRCIKENTQSLYCQHVALTKLILMIGLQVSLRYKRLFELSGINCEGLEKCLIIPLQTNHENCFLHRVQFIRKDKKIEHLKFVIDKKSRASGVVSFRQVGSDRLIKMRDIYRMY